MTGGRQNGQRFQIRTSISVHRSLLEIQRQANNEGRGARVLAAVKEVLLRLTLHPSEFGEPLYRLPALQLQIRFAAVGPIVVQYGVADDRALVFVKRVTLLDAG